MNGKSRTADAGGGRIPEGGRPAVTKMAEFCIFSDNCDLGAFEKVIILIKPGHKRGGGGSDLVL